MQSHKQIIPHWIVKSSIHIVLFGYDEPFVIIHRLFAAQRATKNVKIHVEMASSPLVDMHKLVEEHGFPPLWGNRRRVVFPKLTYSYFRFLEVPRVDASCKGEHARSNSVLSEKFGFWYFLVKIGLKENKTSKTRNQWSMDRKFIRSSGNLPAVSAL
jgi:hypothetical protein